MSADEFGVRVIERRMVQSLKQGVRAYLNETLRYSALSEQVWLVTLSTDGTLRGRVCCFVGEACDAQAYARRMLLAMLQSGAKRFVTVHYFPKEDAERELAARICATGFERLESLTGLRVDDHFIVTGIGEQAWWRSLAKPD